MVMCHSHRHPAQELSHAACRTVLLFSCMRLTARTSLRMRQPSAARSAPGWVKPSSAAPHYVLVAVLLFASFGAL